MSCFRELVRGGIISDATTSASNTNSGSGAATLDFFQVSSDWYVYLVQQLLSLKENMTHTSNNPITLPPEQYNLVRLLQEVVLLSEVQPSPS